MASRQTIDARRPFSNPEGHVHVNALDVEPLFALYERTGFLYPAKAARLRPHMPAVYDTWQRMLQAGDSLLYILSAGTEESGHASIAVWRTTRDSWVWQHLVCERNPLHSRTVMLGGLVRCMRLGIGTSQQNWFRPDNRFPARVFGTMVHTLGPSCASVQRHMYVAMPRTIDVPVPHDVRVVAGGRSQWNALRAVATAARGPLYLTAEALDSDVELAGVDHLYRAVGLRRTRRVWLAYRRGSDEVLGAALAYRGPLGLNFSFLENRCDLLLTPALPPDLAGAAAIALMSAAAQAYADFGMDDVPVVADDAAAAALAECGGQVLRSYCQGIWLAGGQPALYRHVDGFYTRLRQRVERSAARPALPA